MIAFEFLASMELLSPTGGMRMPFPDAVKYCILGISVFLLLVALGILAWQIFRCFSQTYTTYHHQDTVSSELLYSDEKSAGNFSAPPRTEVRDVSAEAHRRSRCLSEASFSPESLQTDQKTSKDEASKMVCGSLRFSVYYDQLQSLLVVTVLQAEGLLDLNQTTSLQPFVRIRLMWAESEGAEEENLREQEGEGTPPVLWTVLQEWRTRIVKGSCNPSFGDQFSCVLHKNMDVLQRINLRMEVRDFDKFSRHTVLGEVRVPLGRLNITYPLELQEDLQTPQQDVVGGVLLSLKLLPTSQRLEVGLLKVRTTLTGISSETALYARISVQCNQNKLRYQKTSAVPCCPVTVFNEVLMFPLSEFPLEECKISVSVFEMHTTGKSNKRLMGQLSVRKEELRGRTLDSDGALSPTAGCKVASPADLRSSSQMTPCALCRCLYQLN